MFLRARLEKLSQPAASAVLNRYPRIAFIHVPKSAGSAVRDSLYEAIYPAALWFTRGYRKIGRRASQSAADLLCMETTNCSQTMLIEALSDPLARFVTGHVCANPKVVAEFPEWKFVTVLREPTSRLISAYVFLRHKVPDPSDTGRYKIDSDFIDYLETDRARRGGIKLTRYFSGKSPSEVVADPEAAIAAALQNLQQFFSVGFVEDLESWARDIGHALGYKVRLLRRNPSPRPEVSTQIKESPELRERVDALCAIDRQLYAAARARFRQESEPVPIDLHYRAQTVNHRRRASGARR